MRGLGDYHDDAVAIAALLVGFTAVFAAILTSWALAACDAPWLVYFLG